MSHNNYSSDNHPSGEDHFGGGSQNWNSQSEHYQRNHPVDISNSTLEPTAREFIPTSSQNGALRKKPHYQNKYRDNKHQGNWRNRYGSGRTFNSSRSNYNKFANEDSSNYHRGDNYDVPTDEQRSSSEYTKNSNHRYSDNTYKANFDVDDSENGDETENNSAPSSSKHYRNSKRYDNVYQGKPRSNYSEKYSKNYEDKRGANYEDKRGANYEDKRGANYEDKRGANYEDKRGANYEDKRGANYEDKRSANYLKHNSNYSYFNEDTSARKTYNNQNYKKGGYKNYDSRSSQKPKESSVSSNWRREDAYPEKIPIKMVKHKKVDAASQRERLVEMLNRRKLECLVCCDKIKNSDKVWSCLLCYHIFHLNCVVEWAKSSKIENGWRCPACQNVCSEVPKKYSCYCGKTVEPRYEPGLLPHSCGEMCLRKGRNCDHKCSIQCHPGPCPDCTIMISKSCGCGSTKQMVKCSTDVEVICDSVCNKQLECGLHYCEQICHSGDCELCNRTILQECYCAKEGRKVPCCGKFKGQTQYSCGEICGKLMSCGNHYCQQLCHEGLCEICPKDVSIIKSCPCGKTSLSQPRLSCLDPIPCCDKICGRVLNCGQPNAPHRCEKQCHEGPCPVCPKATVVRCRCGHMDKELPCQELTTKADDARCEKKCTKKRLCGKHRCNQLCCIEVEHICPLPCNHLLTCGQHRCERTCHSGRCPTCMETSFEELYCECGASVLYPPIPCGTKPPNCTKPCSRRRPCGHDANHCCHTGPCPPCTILCKRWCYGHHEQRSAIPCHQENFSCGLPCGKEAPCGKHKCIKPCHDGPCPSPCKQPCTVPRELCGHICGRPCHDPPCPESSCKQSVPVTCQCGLQKSTRPCLEVADEFLNIQMAQLKDKMGSLATSSTVDLTDIVNVPKKPSVLKILECTEECFVLERNRRLAIGLQIRNPDLSQKLTPRYSDFLKQWGKKDSHFCQRVHDKLTELVQLSKNSKQKSRSYSFDSMNRDKRHFIHEYCEHFGVESAAYDMEPNRNIVATAIKDKSWLPSMSLLEFLQRESGQRKVPGPFLGRGANAKNETVSLKLPSRVQRPNTPPNDHS